MMRFSDGIVFGRFDLAKTCSTDAWMYASIISDAGWTASWIGIYLMIYVFEMSIKIIPYVHIANGVGFSINVASSVVI